MKQELLAKELSKYQIEHLKVIAKYNNLHTKINLGLKKAELVKSIAKHLDYDESSRKFKIRPNVDDFGDTIDPSQFQSFVPTKVDFYHTLVHHFGTSQDKQTHQLWTDLRKKRPSAVLQAMGRNTPLELISEDKIKENVKNEEKQELISSTTTSSYVRPEENKSIGKTDEVSQLIKPANVDLVSQIDTSTYDVDNPYGYESSEYEGDSGYDSDYIYQERVRIENSDVNKRNDMRREKERKDEEREEEREREIKRKEKELYEERERQRKLLYEGDSDSDSDVVEFEEITDEDSDEEEERKKQEPSEIGKEILTIRNLERNLPSTEEREDIMENDPRMVERFDENVNKKKIELQELKKNINERMKKYKWGKNMNNVKTKKQRENLIAKLKYKIDVYEGRVESNDMSDLTRDDAEDIMNETELRKEDNKIFSFYQQIELLEYLEMKDKLLSVDSNMLFSPIPQYLKQFEKNYQESESESEEERERESESESD